MGYLRFLPCLYLIHRHNVVAVSKFWFLILFPTLGLQAKIVKWKQDHIKISRDSTQKGYRITYFPFVNENKQRAHIFWLTYVNNLSFGDFKHLYD